MVLSAHYVVGIATIPYSLELVARYIYRDYDAEQAAATGSGSEESGENTEQRKQNKATLHDLVLLFDCWCWNPCQIHPTPRDGWTWSSQNSI